MSDPSEQQRAAGTDVRADPEQEVSMSGTPDVPTSLRADYLSSDTPTDPQISRPQPQSLDENAAQISGRGVAALQSDTFDAWQVFGGVRGLVESVLPGVVFVAVFVATRDLQVTLIAAGALAVVAVVARMVQRTPVTQALAGVGGVAIGVLWAWRTGEASDYFAWGLYVNAAYSVALLISLLVRWPAVGVVVEGFKAGFAWAEDAKREESAELLAGEAAIGDPVTDTRVAAATGAEDGAGTGVAEGPAQTAEALARPAEEPAQTAEGPAQTKAWTQWRREPAAFRSYLIATWLWLGMFAARLAVQVPLYLQGDDGVGWLGTARIVMGMPLWALVLWLTWLLIRRPAADEGPARPQPIH